MCVCVYKYNSAVYPSPLPPHHLIDIVYSPYLYIIYYIYICVYIYMYNDNVRSCIYCIGI